VKVQVGVRHGDGGAAFFLYGETIFFIAKMPPEKNAGSTRKTNMRMIVCFKKVNSLRGGGGGGGGRGMKKKKKKKKKNRKIKKEIYEWGLIV